MSFEKGNKVITTDITVDFSRRAATQTILFLIRFTSLAMIEKRSKRRLKKVIHKIVKNS